MSDSVEASGRSVEEAIDKALDLLDASEDEVEIQILSEGDESGDPLVRGEARVRARFRDERVDQFEDGPPQRSGGRAIPPEEAETQALEVQAFLQGLLSTMQLEGDVHVEATSTGAAADIQGDDLAVLIGKHGATLAAVQELCRAVAQKASTERAVITVDVEGYLERRVERLERLARSLAQRARKSGRRVSMEPMNARDRKVVHDALTEMAGVRTESEGDEPHRYVVIVPR